MCFEGLVQDSILYNKPLTEQSHFLYLKFYVQLEHILFNYTLFNCK